MRMSDWSSDVCSSDLTHRARQVRRADHHQGDDRAKQQFGGSEIEHDLGQCQQRSGSGTVVLHFLKLGFGIGGLHRRLRLKALRLLRLPLVFSHALLEAFDALGDIAQHVDRKSVVEGKSVSVRLDLGGRSNIKKKKKVLNTTRK